MINTTRFTYLINTNNQSLNNNDYMNIGYMAGRYGINLNNNPYETNPILNTQSGILVNINSCTSSLFENNLKNAGIKFDRIA